jgi:hypothetical protein
LVLVSVPLLRLLPPRRNGVESFSQDDMTKSKVGERCLSQQLKQISRPADSRAFLVSPDMQMVPEPGISCVAYRGLRSYQFHYQLYQNQNCNIVADLFNLVNTLNSRPLYVSYARSLREPTSSREY